MGTNRQTWRWALAASIAATTLGLGSALGQGPTNLPPIRVACFDVAGTGEKDKGVGNMRRCLSPSPDFVIQTVTSGDIRSNALARIDVLICPGGSGHKQADALDPDGRHVVQDFVRNGGGYIGFCAGAYLASCQYTWSLGLLNANVVDRAHWARGTGNVTLKLTPAGRKILSTAVETVTCYYGQGPLLAPGNLTNLPPYQVLATYNSEIAKKGAPTGVMIGTTAIAAGKYGKGRVLCFSPHPEKTKGLEDFVRRAVRWAAGQD